MKSMNRVFIVHGFNAAPEKHWFPWLQTQLTARQIPVQVLRLPSPQHPVYDEWLQTLKNEIRDVDEHTFFVGHSLGCITILKFLQQLPAATRVGGAVLVSGFDRALPKLPQLDPFTQEPPDYAQLVAMVKCRAVLSAQNDWLVPHAFSEELARHFAARFVSVPRGGHFLDREGVTKLPPALALLEGMLQEVEQN